MSVQRRSIGGGQAKAANRCSASPERTCQPGAPSSVKAKLIAASVALLLFALLLFAPGASNAALMSPQDLLTACSGDAMARATCNGYLMAATDLVLRRESHGGTNAKVCLPPGVTVDQVRDAVLNFGQQGRPLQAPAGLGLIAAAMHRAWPCQGSTGEPGRDEPGTNGGRWPRRDPGPRGEPGAPRDQ